MVEQVDSADSPLAVYCLYGDRHRQLHRHGTGGWDASALGDVLAAAPARLAAVHRSVLVRAAVCDHVAPGDAPTKSPRRRRRAARAAQRLLAGGNPQIAKADGDAPVQAYIAAMPGWKRDVGRRLDALIVRTVPGVQQGGEVELAVLRSRGPGLVPQLPYLHELREGHFLPRHVAASCPTGRVEAQGSALRRHP